MTPDEGFGTLGAGPDVWETLTRWRRAGRRFVWLTVVESRGFTPRKSGTHMLLAADGETVGTIGGGAIEHEVLREARELLASDAESRTVRRHLTHELGMCCGGEMVVHLEVLAGLPRLFVYGAGYLGTPIARLAASTGFAVTLVDERPEWADPARAPGVGVVCADAEHHARALATHAGDHVVIVTHDHALDQRLVREFLARDVAFVGMIGSLGKRARFLQRLRAQGVPDAALARLRTPLGVAIGARTPEEIAVSVVADLIAFRHGADPAGGWRARAARGEVLLAGNREGDR